MLVWQADEDTHALVENIKVNNHLPRLEEASIAVCFNDSKPFVAGRFNWGKVQKFSNIAKLFQDRRKYDFLINLPMDAWVGILDDSQKKAWLDLHLCRCQVDYVPQTVEENGIKKPAKDHWGRIIYTGEIKRDDEGIPKWKVVPLDLPVYQENVFRYGCWCVDLMDFKSILLKDKELIS